MKYSPLKCPCMTLYLFPQVLFFLVVFFQEGLAKAPFGRLGSQSPDVTGHRVLSFCKDLNVVLSLRSLNL